MSYKNSNVAIIKADVNGLLNSEIRSNGIEIFQLFSENSLLTNILKRTLALNYQLPVDLNKYYNQAITNIKQDTIILFDTVYAQDAVRWLKKNHPKKRIIIWYWNPVAESCLPNRLTDVEKWSYSPAECKNYAMYYNTTYYFSSISYENSEIIRDVFFIGLNKGRMQMILNYKDFFEKLGLKCYFHVSPTRKYLPCFNSIYKKYISYRVILNEIGKSKAILDLYTNKNSGLSLRPMEAMFFRKKLITNHTDVQNYDFYNSNNIFILGQDNINNLKAFIDEPYEATPKEILERYEFRNWLKRFAVC